MDNIFVSGALSFLLGLGIVFGWHYLKNGGLSAFNQNQHHDETNLAKPPLSNLSEWFEAIVVEGDKNEL